MHEEADGKGDIEATIGLDFGGLHAGGGVGVRPKHRPGMECPQIEKWKGGIPASQSPAKHIMT